MKSKPVAQDMLGAKASRLQPSYIVARNVDMAMRDGVVLRADIWAPASADPAPAILIRTPYNKALYSADVLRPQHIVEAGFVAVVQDTRGRFASDGDWRFNMWDQEGPDTFDSVEWIAAQGWCSGAVGMAGPSYLGIAQLVGAELKPPHLKAIAPSMATTPEFDRQESGGAFRLDQVIGWLAFMAWDWLEKKQKRGEHVAPEHAALVYEAFQNPQKLLNHRPLRTIPIFELPGFPVSFESVSKLNAAVTVEIDIREIGIPTLHVGGWYDIFARSTVEMFRAQRAAGHPAHMLMGCWAHSGALREMQGQKNFGATAAAVDAQIPAQHLAFFRKYLCGDGEAPPPARYFVMNADQWRDASEWPPAETVLREFHLGSGARGANTDKGDGVLLASAPGAAGFDVFDYNPDDPPPTIGGHILSLLGSLAPGPIDQRPLTRRNDVLCYTSEPFETALDIVGPVRAELSFSSSAPDTDLVVKLIDVDPHDVALPVSDGILRLRWREGFAAPIYLRAGEITSVSINLTDVAWRVKPGHRLRLQVQGATFPQFDANTNTGQPMGVDAAGVVAHNKLHHGRGAPSKLVLSIAP